MYIDRLIELSYLIRRLKGIGIESIRNEIITEIEAKLDTIIAEEMKD